MGMGPDGLRFRVHAASKEKHFPGAELQESEGSRNGHSMTAANGSKIADEGKMTVTARTENGMKVRIPFVNANVQMPILSIAKLGKDHDTFFGQTSGELIHRVSNKRIPFVKRSGVYFMKVAVPKSIVQPNSSGVNTAPFGRSGN